MNIGLFKYQKDWIFDKYNNFIKRTSYFYLKIDLYRK